MATPVSGWAAGLLAVLGITLGGNVSLKALSALPLFLLLFVVAPYRVYVDERMRADKFERERRPTIAASGRVVNQYAKRLHVWM